MKPRWHLVVLLLGLALVIGCRPSYPGTGGKNNMTIAPIDQNDPKTMGLTEASTDAVQLRAPEQAATRVGTTNLGFYWTSVPDATSYSFVLSLNDDLTGAVVSEETSSTSLNVVGPLDYSGTYYWQVKAWKDSTLISTSNVGVFTVMVDPSISAAQAPDFTLTDLDGRSISLSDYRGKAVLLTFWAIDCPYCIAEMSYLESEYREQKDNLVILTIDIGDKPDEVKQFLTRRGLSLPVLFDSRLTVTRDYNLIGIPTNFFIDSEGIIKDKVIGGFTNKEALDSRLAKILPDEEPKN